MDIDALITKWRCKFFVFEDFEFEDLSSRQSSDHGSTTDRQQTRHRRFCWLQLSAIDLQVCFDDSFLANSNDFLFSDRYKVFIDLFNLASFLIPREFLPKWTTQMKMRLAVANVDGNQKDENEEKQSKDKKDNSLVSDGTFRAVTDWVPVHAWIDDDWDWSFFFSSLSLLGLFSFFYAYIFFFFCWFGGEVSFSQAHFCSKTLFLIYSTRNEWT